MEVRYSFTDPATVSAGTGKYLALVKLGLSNVPEPDAMVQTPVFVAPFTLHSIEQK